MSSPTGLTYQWKKNGVIIPGATSNILNIPSALDVDDNSVFEVVVTNLNGSVSSYRANLDVLRKVKIVEHPISQTVTTGQTVTLYVKVSGDGPFVFLWRKDGALLSETYVDSYTISNITLADAGNYNVLVKNDFSQAMSNVAAITVLEKPEIIINPSITTIQIDPVINITKVIPEKIKFDLNVSAKGTPPLSTQWRKDGVDIPRATNNLLTLTSPLTSDSGIYDAVVRNVVGEDISARYELKVLAPPRITVQPVLPPKVILGDNVTFTATATGSPVLKYQWRKNNTDIDSANSTSYTVQAIPQNYGDYTLYVSNEVGNTVSVKVSLTDANVLKKPEIIKHPVSLITRVGGMATFTVTATGSPTLTYQWKRGDTNILGANFATFTINPVSLSNAGDYNVVVSNPAGSAVSNFATLSVGVAPTIITQPSSVSVIVNNNTEFNVVASGTEVLTYQWRKNSVDIPNATLSSFPIFNVQAADVANYDVVIKNDYGTVTSTKATLTLLYPPKITLNPSSSSLRSGTKINLVAAATGTNPLQYQWRFNGQNISGATKTSYDKITSFSLQNEGVYDIVVSNSVGSVTSLPATLKLITPPSIKNIIITDSLSSTTYNTSTRKISAWGQFNKNLKVDIETLGDEPMLIAYSSDGIYVVNTNPYSTSTTAIKLSANASDELGYAFGDYTDSQHLTLLSNNKKNFNINVKSNNFSIPSSLGLFGPTKNIDPFSINVILSNITGVVKVNKAIDIGTLSPVSIITQPVYLNTPIPIQLKPIVGGTNPRYQWYKNDTIISGATGLNYNVTSKGIYKFVVTNLVNSVTSKEVTVDPVWTQLGSDINGEVAGDMSGRVSMNAAGDRVAIGANYNDGNDTTNSNRGHVRIYQWSGTAWTQLGSDIDGEATGDESGRVSMNAAGDRVAIGAINNDGNDTTNSVRGHVRIYQWNGIAWTQLGSDIDGEAIGNYSGASVSMNAAGDRVAIGASLNDGNDTTDSNRGHVRIYQWSGTAWTQLGIDIDGEAASDQSGGSVSMNAAGDRVAIGAPNNDGKGADSGHVRIYTSI